MKIKSLLMFILILFASSAAMAHPPSSIDVSIKDNSITLIVKHQVANPLDHYISSVKVISGEKVIFEGSFKEQSSKDEHTIDIPLKDIKRPFKITVEAVCNKWGRLTKEIEIK
ncbi:MAG: hypothetical protein NZ900_08060 [Synergistetes bacterium]|nr:hypothetical protein [Synergistota bacterium]MDW8192872.1 hypothetical protein [Synergistota bacterium]